MLISNFDLYKTEWLDLVFADRNKAYGAYELRQHYHGTMVKAMALTFLSLGILCTVSIVFSHPGVVVRPVPKDPVITITLHPHISNPPAPPQRARQLPKPLPVKTTALPPLVVKPDLDIKTPPPDVTKIPGAIGPVTIDGPGTGPNGPHKTSIDPGTGDPPPLPDNTVYPALGLEVMPTPIGGEAVWNKFLSKNLRFPQQAQDAGVSGRVFMSFVIEKDGSLSNFTVERGAGYGMDEEATRVLKLAKAWKPGLQNGRPVRVKFIIPINFQFGGDNQ